MSIIEWNENFSVSCYAIDEQHKELFNLINNVIDTIREENYTFSNLLSVVNSLDNYINEHFKYEEMLMKKSTFPYREEHVKEHNLARQKVHKINVFVQEEFEKQFFEDILYWLVTWLTKHIIITDKKLEPYL